jgi:hypothetical protein
VDDATHDPRSKPTLRGRGRQILLGQHADDLGDLLGQIETNEISPVDETPLGDIDPSALPLTAEERATLLDFSPAAPVYQADLSPLPPRVETASRNEDLLDWGEDTTQLPAIPVYEPPPLPPAPGDEWTDLDDPILPDVMPAAEIAAPTVRSSSPVERLPVESSLLNTLVDDEQVKKLWQQIEALHEKLIQDGQGDTYQVELQQASSLLLASRSNYEEVRRIVYRVRTDMNRQTKVAKDIEQYHSHLLLYYVGWGIAWVVLFLLKQLVASVWESVGVGIVGAFYHPMLFGVLGALIAGYLALERHTTKLRDFDPAYITWYLFNPLLGGVTGLLMFLIYSIVNADVLQESASQLELSVAWLLCAIMGMNQNTLLNQMNHLLKRIGRGKS